MYNRLISLYILLLVSLSFVSTQNCEDYEQDKCGDYLSNDGTKKCIFDDEVGKCQLKACSNDNGCELKNVVIIKVQIVEILFLLTYQDNVFLKVMNVKK